MKLLRTRQVKVGTVTIGGKNPVVLIAGPCVIEGWEKTYALARKLKKIAAQAAVPLIFKASYDKANRTSLNSFRGPGLKEGLEILAQIRKQVSIPVLSDVHRFEEIAPAAEVLDILQIPAFLSRQTDFIIEVARTGKPVNVKKGQFLSPHDIAFVIEKVTGTGNSNLLITERGSTFGYHNLVVDMRALVILREFGYPVVFDATHSVQLPGGKGDASGGERKFVAPLARAAAAVGIDALFLEVHENPDQALCDGPNSLPLSDLPLLLKEIARIGDPSRSW
ncbi:MAG: 3-deoxy-8-phosphooctulonate synthase [Proteobacteria bacterium]|nr:3-deoxy-8-phosphooctulonate synthase [Pseudomonadota bacterium]